MTLTVGKLQELPFAGDKVKKRGKSIEPIAFKLQKEPDRTVTIFPVENASDFPDMLVEILMNEFNYVIDEGLTYPHAKVLSLDDFKAYWFQAFAAVLVDGNYKSREELSQLTKSELKRAFLGTFYIKPNYIDRCSHVCNAGFLVNHEMRGLGLGKELGLKYLDFAAQLGYVYSVFNLVFETNVASLKIWDSLGFDRIGYIKNVAVLKGHNKLVGAYMYGKDIVPPN